MFKENLRSMSAMDYIVIGLFVFASLIVFTEGSKNRTKAASPTVWGYLLAAGLLIALSSSLYSLNTAMGYMNGEVTVDALKLVTEAARSASASWYFGTWILPMLIAVQLARLAWYREVKSFHMTQAKVKLICLSVVMVVLMTSGNHALEMIVLLLVAAAVLLSSLSCRRTDLQEEDEDLFSHALIFATACVSVISLVACKRYEEIPARAFTLALPHKEIAEMVTEQFNQLSLSMQYFKLSILVSFIPVIEVLRQYPNIRKFKHCSLLVLLIALSIAPLILTDFEGLWIKYFGRIWN